MGSTDDDIDHHHQGNNMIDLNAEPDCDNNSVPCSICLDLVSFGDERSTAKLQCGHQFHLDCIGSAFNMKGMMQCPNCRKIEKGRWLFASGPTNSSPDFSSEDGGIDNYPVYISFAETPFRIHICPFRGLTQVHPSSESNLGMISAPTPMIPHRHQHHHPGSVPHPHGWVQFHHAPFHHHQQLPAIPMPFSGGASRFDMPRSIPRFMPPGRIYDPSAGFSLHAETHSVGHPHAWGRDNLPHYPMP